MEERLRGASSSGEARDTLQMYCPLCETRSGLSCTVTDTTVLFPISVLLIWPLISLPLGLTQAMSGIADSAVSFVTAQVMEYALPAVAMPSVDVDTITTDAGTENECHYCINTYKEVIASLTCDSDGGISLLHAKWSCNSALVLSVVEAVIDYSNVQQHLPTIHTLCHHLFIIEPLSREDSKVRRAVELQV